MAITSRSFRATNRNLLRYKWEGVDKTFGAKLVLDSYSYSKDHSTYADFGAHTTGDAIVVQNKTKRLFDRNQFLVFDCDSLDFSSQGTVDARGVLVFYMPNGAPENDNPILFYYDFGETISVSQPLDVNGDYGLYAMKGTGFIGDLVYAESFESYTTGEKWLGETQTQIIEDVDNTGNISKMIRCEYIPLDIGSFRIYRSINLPTLLDHAKLTFWVFFESDFDFSKGGKMHGFEPLDEVSGGLIVNPDEYSARLMWRDNGTVQCYDYHQDMTSTFGEGEVSTDVAFTKGRWHFVEMETKLNTTATSQDGYNIMSVDGEPYSTNLNRRFRGEISDATKINAFVFVTFFGGNKPEWAPSTTVYARFDDFRVYNLAAS